MATKEELERVRSRRIKSSNERETHHSRIPRPANWRATLWVVGATVLAGSFLGALNFSHYSNRVAYSQSQINEQLARRVPFGESSTKIKRAEAYFADGVFQVDAYAADETYSTSLSLTAQMGFDDLSGRVTIKNPETTVATPVKQGSDAGDAASAYVPSDWTLIEAVVRTTANIASGDAMASSQFGTKAKRALWALPLFEIPAGDRHLFKGSTVDSILPTRGGIVITLSDRRLNAPTSICLILLVASSVLLLALRSNPDMAMGD